MEMSKLKLSDPKVTNNAAEKRTSQRATRSTSRQLKEVNIENDPESKTTDGHRSPGMWTPGMHTPSSKTNGYRSRNSVWLEYHK
jgi:hypothetical protein